MEGERRVTFTDVEISGNSKTYRKKRQTLVFCSLLVRKFVLPNLFFLSCLFFFICGVVIENKLLTWGK